jgi:hypothetical protein
VRFWRSAASAAIRVPSRASDQAGPAAEDQHLVGVACAKAGDRRVVGRLVGGDHPEGDVLRAAALDPPRGALADRVGVEQQRDHHLGVVGGSTPAVLPVAGEEALEVHLRDGV